MSYNSWDADHGAHAELENDLNIVPILDALVTLIAFLITSMSTPMLGKIDTKFLGAANSGDSAVTSEESYAPPKIEISNEKIVFNGSTYTWEELDKIYAAAKEEKVKQPKVFKIFAKVNGEIPYEKVVTVMSSLRAIRGMDEALTVKADGTEVKLRLLFPDIVWEDAT